MRRWPRQGGASSANLLQVAVAGGMQTLVPVAEGTISLTEAVRATPPG